MQILGEKIRATKMDLRRMLDELPAELDRLRHGRDSALLLDPNDIPINERAINDMEHDVVLQARAHPLRRRKIDIPELVDKVEVPAPAPPAPKGVLFVSSTSFEKKSIF